MRLKLINLSLIFLFSIFIIQLTNKPVFADQLTATDSTTESKLKTLENDIASKASLLKDTISKQLQNKAYAGSLKSKAPLSLEINLNLGSVAVKYTEFTQFVGKKITSAESFNIGDNLVALGDVDENGVMSAREIVKVDAPPIFKASIWGHVIENDKQGLVIQTKDDKKYNIDTDSDTDIHSDTGSLDLTKLKNNLVVIVSGIKNGDDKIFATLIYIPPTTPSLSPTKTATISATPTASPSASPKPEK